MAQRPLPTESDIPMHGWAPYTAIHRERIRAHVRHDANGGSMERKEWDHPIWLAVLGEEFGEVARVLCEAELGNIGRYQTRHALIGELVQTGAMVAAWIDALRYPGQTEEDGD